MSRMRTWHLESLLSPMRNDLWMVKHMYCRGCETSRNAFWLIAEVKNYIESPAVRRKMEDDEMQSKRAAESASSAPVGNSMEASNREFIDRHQQQTKQQIAQQDESLQMLSQSADRLHHVATEVNLELRTQNRMLDELETDLDVQQGKMAFVQDKLSKLLKTKDGCQIWTVVILTVILIILGNEFVFHMTRHISL